MRRKWVEDFFIEPCYRRYIQAKPYRGIQSAQNRHLQDPLPWYASAMAHLLIAEDNELLRDAVCGHLCQGWSIRFG